MTDGNRDPVVTFIRMAGFCSIAGRVLFLIGPMTTILTRWAITQHHSLDIQFKETRQYTGKTLEINNLPNSYAFDFRTLNLPAHGGSLGRGVTPGHAGCGRGNSIHPSQIASLNI